MRLFASHVAALVLLATPAISMEIEEIGALEADFAGERIVESTVEVTDGDEVSATAFLFLAGGGFSSLTLMSGNANFVVEAGFMSHEPGVGTVPISTAVTFAPGGSNEFWLSEGAPQPLELTFTKLTIDGDTGHAEGSFRGLLCFAEGLGADADPQDCRPIEGSFNSPFQVER